MNSGSINADLLVESHDDKMIFRFKLNGIVGNQEWADLFETVLNNNSNVTQFRFLVDNRFGIDQIDINGFKMLGKLFREYNVQECSISVLTKDRGMEILKELFLNVMKSMGLDYECQVFFNERDALVGLTQ